MTDDGEVVALFFPDVKDNLGESACERHARDLLAAALFYGVKPRPEWARTAHRLSRGQDQYPAHEPIAFFADVAGPHPAGAGAHARGQPDVAGQALGVREAVNVADLEHEDDGDEGPDAGNGQQPLHPRIAPPAHDHLGIQAADLRVEHGEQRSAVLADATGGVTQRELLQLALPALG